VVVVLVGARMRASGEHVTSHTYTSGADRLIRFESSVVDGNTCVRNHFIVRILRAGRMNHTGLKARMAVVGSILFAFYALLAIVAVEAFGVSVPLVLLGTVAFAGFQYVIGKKISLWSVGAEDMPEDRYPEIHRAVERIADDMDLEKPRLMVADMGVPNAFAVGRRGAGVVVVSSELIRLLDRDELEGVLAHELAHIDNRDVVTMVMGQSIASMLGMAAYFAIAFSREGGLGNIVLGYLASVVVQMVAMVFVLAISRYREYVADADAAEHVGGDAMASALQKISSAGSQSNAELDDNVAALCIFGGERSALQRLFATHPPIEKRIEAVRDVERSYY
jgi:heat shock protein HtpX